MVSKVKHLNSGSANQENDALKSQVRLKELLVDEKSVRGSPKNQFTANWTYGGDHFAVYTSIESLYCTPKASIMLYGNGYFNLGRKQKLWDRRL